MSRTTILCSLVMSAVACCAFAVAQQAAQPTPPPPAGGGAGFAVSPAGDSAVLLETRSGRTWLMVRSSDRLQPAVWLPIERLEQRQQAAEWDTQQRERARALQQNAPIEHRLKELPAMLAEHRARSVDPNQNTSLKRFEAEIAELEAKLRAAGPSNAP